MRQLFMILLTVHIGNMSKKEKEEKSKHPKLKQSETVVIKRSQIRLNPRNVKRHGDEKIRQQLKNFKRVGYLSGIIWNKTTGNLVAGHKRTLAQDLFYGNKPGNPVDYDLKVEMVEMDEKTELEQLVYMDARSTNTPQDYDLVALILPDIDYNLAGLSADELNLISIESPMLDLRPKKEIQKEFKELSKEFEKKKAEVIAAKQKIKSEVAENQGESYVTLSFDSYENKCEFMERFGFDNTLRFIKGESFNDLIEKR